MPHNYNLHLQKHMENMFVFSHAKFGLATCLDKMLKAYI